MAVLLNLKSELFKALGHPIRIKIIELLKEGELCVCIINEKLEQSQPNISQHLSKLKKADLVKSRKEGLQVYYSLKDDEIIEILELSKKIILKQINQTRQDILKEN